MRKPPPATPPPDSQSEDRLDQDPATAFGWEDADDSEVKSSIKETINEFKTLDYKFLMPVSQVFSKAFLKKKAVRWVLLFALLPLIFHRLYQWLNLDIKQSIWLIEGYFCLFWALYFYQLIKPSRSSWHRAITYSAFTAIIGIPILLASHELPVIRQAYSITDSGGFVARLFGYIFGVGLLEELCKALPLLIFGLGRKHIIHVRDGVFLGLMSGFGFAAVEGVQYTFEATLRAHDYQTVSMVSGQFMQFIFRMMTGPLLHGAWAAIVGWFIGISVMKYNKSWPVIVVGILYAAALHGIYDVFSGQLLGIIVAGITLLLFMYYLIHGYEATRDGSGIGNGE